MNQKNSNNWPDLFEEIVTIYNNRAHTSTQFKPIDILNQLLPVSDRSLSRVELAQRKLDQNELILKTSKQRHQRTPKLK